MVEEEWKEGEELEKVKSSEKIVRMIEAENDMPMTALLEEEVDV